MKNLLGMFEKAMSKKITRRTFLKGAATGAMMIAVQNLFLRKVLAIDETSTGRPKSGIKGDYDLVLAEGTDPYQNTIKAVESMGGMERFVKKGGVCVVKPNIGWDRTPEQAANTNPSVVAAIVDMCFKAGAKKVNVFDNTCNESRSCYEHSGIQKAAQERGANVFFADDWNVLKAKFKYKSPMEGWPVLRDAIACDTFINVPVLKNHGLTGLTLSIKNLMGVCMGNRGMMHVDIGRKLVDMTDFINPDLTIIDAHRVITANGPTGGNLADVKVYNKLIAATDPVLADAFASQLVGINPMNISYIKMAVERGLGSADFTKAKTLDLKL